MINPSPITFGQSATVTSTIRYDGPAAGENVTMTYTTTDGCLVPNGAAEAGSNCQELTQMVKVAPGNTQHTVRLDTSKMTLTAGGPSKSVTITAEGKGPSANAAPKSATVSVTAPPAPPAPAVAPPKLTPIQLDDVIFTRNGARVNNCGKRVIDQAYERAASMGNYDVLLVGHYDAVEKNFRVRDRKTRTNRTLDEERVLNVAAVMTAGVEPCKRLAKNRIKVAYVGGEQLSPFKTSLCEATVKERGGSKVSAADGNAKNRRVEIWLVPRNGDMPNGIGGIKDAPQTEIESKGCPK
ncbi:MAG: hypothetical protein OHK0021_23070 [Bryobacter sp.]